MHGNLKSVRVVINKITHQSAGYGFVEFELLEDALKAIESLNGRQIGYSIFLLSNAVSEKKD